MQHPLWKESLNSDGQQIHIYQQNNHLWPPLTEHTKKRPWHIYDTGNSDTGLVEAQTFIGVKPYLFVSNCSKT